MPRKNAFTLIELLIVVAIIAILAAIAVPNFLEAQVRAKVSRVKSDLRSLATALESYVVDHNHYPYGHGNLKYRGDLAGVGTISNISAPLVSLTTPVAYITAVPGIVFAAADQLDRNGTDTGRPLPQEIPWLTFWYSDREFREDMEWPAPGTWKEHNWNQWVLHSTGPSKQWAFFSTHDIIYDPTNGTASRGGIYRGGPG